MLGKVTGGGPSLPTCQYSTDTNDSRCTNENPIPAPKSTTCVRDGPDWVNGTEREGERVGEEC